MQIANDTLGIREDISAATYSLIQRVESVAGTLVGTLAVWVQRYRSRSELAQLSQRTLADVGLTRGDVLIEMNKPFWRA